MRLFMFLFIYRIYHRNAAMQTQSIDVHFQGDTQTHIKSISYLLRGYW